MARSIIEPRQVRQRLAALTAKTKRPKRIAELRPFELTNKFFGWAKF